MHIFISASRLFPILVLFLHCFTILFAKTLTKCTNYFLKLKCSCSVWSTTRNCCLMCSMCLSELSFSLGKITLWWKKINSPSPLLLFHRKCHVRRRRYSFPGRLKQIYVLCVSCPEKLHKGNGYKKYLRFLNPRPRRRWFMSSFSPK